MGRQLVLQVAAEKEPVGKADLGLLIGEQPFGLGHLFFTVGLSYALVFLGSVTTG